MRAGCKAVAEQATHIQIDVDRIPAYAAALSISEATRPAHDPECHFLNHGDDTAAYFITLDAINFGSGYFPHLRKHTGRSGYFTVAGCLTEHFEQYGPISARDLIRVTAADCTRIFVQDPGNAPIKELMRLFARALNELGAYLQTNFGGSFTGLIAAGSREEIEIRACALHAVELIKAALNESGQPINAMTLDFFLWNRGQQPAYKSIPRHRTRTYFY